MKFSIVVPAFNEERAVKDILDRCLKAAKHIREGAVGIDSVEVLLVNDGSSDKTEELARSIPGIKVVSHPINRGYGAALKTGFECASGEIVGFLDADGTCDPEFFRELLKTLVRGELDVVSGSRMHAQSRMPRVRYIGNWLFRSLVNSFSEARVNDVASGMRVFRRKALDRLYPLPNGLSFTPAMTVRAVLDPDLSMGEVAMPYEERVGRSKLRVVQDGFRFLGAILDTAATYRPLFFFGCVAAVLAVLSVLVLCLKLGGPAAPILFYIKNRRVEDWMIFRIVLVTVWVSLAAFLVALGMVAQAMTGVINRSAPAPKRAFAGWGFCSLLLAVYINRRPLVSYWNTGHIPAEFWVFPVVGSIFALVGAELIAFAFVYRIARLLKEREDQFRSR